MKFSFFLSSLCLSSVFLPLVPFLGLPVKCWKEWLRADFLALFPVLGEKHSVIPGVGTLWPVRIHTYIHTHRHVYVHTYMHTYRHIHTVLLEYSHIYSFTYCLGCFYSFLDLLQVCYGCLYLNFLRDISLKFSWIGKNAFSGNWALPTLYDELGVVRLLFSEEFVQSW